MTKKIITLVLVLCVSLLLTPACAMAQKTTLTISLWGSAQENNAWIELFEKFEEEHPNIEVEPVFIPGNYETKVQTMIAGGRAPDLMRMMQQNFTRFAELGALLDLNGYIERDRDKYDIDDIYPVLIDMWEYDGVRYGLPFDYNPTLVSYNEGLFEEAGMPVPHRGWTWGDVVEMGKKLTKRDDNGNITQYGFSTGWGLTSLEAWARSGGTYVISDDCQDIGINTPEGIQALQFLQDLSYKHEISPQADVNMSASGMTFNAGRIAMQEDGHWNVPTYLARPDLKWNMTDFPHAPNQPQGTIFGAGCFVIGGQTKHPEEAWQLLNFISGEEGQSIIVESGIAMPVRRSMTELAIETTTSYDQSIFADVFTSYTVMFPAPPSYYAVERVLQAALDPVIRGKKTAEEHVPTIIDQVEAALEY